MKTLKRVININCGAVACVVASVLPNLQSLQPNSSNMSIADVDKGWNVEAKWHIMERRLLSAPFLRGGYNRMFIAVAREKYITNENK